MWAVGVFFASLLSGRYPCVRSVDDLIALAEVTELFGSKRISAVASKMNRTFVIDKKIQPPCELRQVVQRLRDSLISNRCGDIYEQNIYRLFLPTEAYDLLDSLLEPDPDKRSTAEQALKHPFFSDALKLV